MNPSPPPKTYAPGLTALQHSLLNVSAFGALERQLLLLTRTDQSSSTHVACPTCPRTRPAAMSISAMLLSQGSGFHSVLLTETTLFSTPIPKT